MRRTLAAAAVAALVLTGCSGTDEPTSSESPTTGSASAADSPSPSEDGSASDAPTASPTSESDEEALEVEIEGDRIEPNGKRVKVAAGETITFDVESDRDAELHVHSSPEQVLEIARGESTLTLVVDRPGIVDIEEHETGLILFQLEVR